MLERLQPGQFHQIRQTWAVIGARGSGTILIHVAWGHFQREVTVRFAGCGSPLDAKISAATITHYPGACRSAFAWRGDMDLYDESTLQSVEGLEVTFGLAARYRMPQTIDFHSTSTRLGSGPVITG